MLMVVLQLLAGLLTIAVIIAANGYFVAQEFAFMAVDRQRLSAAASAGDEAAARALAVTRRTSFMLSGAQLGITVTGLLVGFVAEPLVGAALGQLLGHAGVPAALGISVGTTATLLLSTIVQMIFGELYPKNLAIAEPDRLARRLARSTVVYLRLFGWIITVFDVAADRLLRLLRIEPLHDLDSSATAQDLERIVAESRDSGDLPAGLSLMLDRILDFPDKTVEHALVPRSQVDTVGPDTTLTELRRLMAQGHSRYPVVDGQQVVGLVQLGDLLRARGHEVSVAELARDPVVVSESMSLPDALRALEDAGVKLACVVDEYGDFSGILTFEDLAEEVVGELHDEHDTDLAPLVVARDGAWVVDGQAPVDEVERAVGHDLPEGDYETLGGLLIATAGELPSAGQVVRVDLPGMPWEDPGAQRVRAVDLEVLEVERYVPSLVRLSLVTDDEVDGAIDAPSDGEED
ncbi:HlyC/CorC family transporter [Knoellia sp. DB2414S]|uniref:HlyC/CorC family transporter n=2 Tax=Knoellia koreensis TaxID=2730921 RepID=A0A849HMQ9_9MICO|nr:HlyC/CorC family transporter [Knoellia sp. DB2414S]